MSGGTLVWLTDDELQALDRWYWWGAVSDVVTDADVSLHDKLDAKREEVACRVPGAGRVLARDA